MINLQVNLKGRNEPIYAKCDRYEIKDEQVGSTVERWLVVYRGDKESGRYRLDDVLGYHEFQQSKISF